jgi:HEAT repeat protein
MTRKRRLRIAVYSALGTLLLLPVLVTALDTYTRQLFFGPTIRDVPFCAWQRSFQHYATGGKNSDDAVTKAFAWLGIRSSIPTPWRQHDPELLPVVLSLANDPNPRVRREVAYSLGEAAHTAETEEALIHFLDDTAPGVRASAAEAIGNLKTVPQAALPKLRERMDDPDEECRVPSAYAVCCATKEKNEKALRILRQGLQSGNWEIRADSASCLCMLGKVFPEGFAEIVGLARRDKAVRRRFSGAGHGYGPVAVPVLVELLSEQDESCRVLAARSLGKLGPDAMDAISALVRAQDDGEVFVREAARKSLSQIDPLRYSLK